MEEIKNIEAEKPFAFEVEGAPHIAVPENFNVHLAEEVLPKPVRDRRRVCLVDVDSFSQYLQIHKTDRAAVHVNAVWPNENNTRPLAVGFCDDGNAQTTSWRDHEVELHPVLSKDFEDWSGIDGQEIGQLDLVRFLDRHLFNIFQPEDQPNSPSAAEVMTFVSNLSDVRKVEFKKSINLDNGRVQITYNELDSDGATASIQIPKEFWIRLKPIVGNESSYFIRVALRYRIKDNVKLTFTLEFRDLQPLMEDIRKEIINALKAKVAPVPVFLTR
jgi:uncharacterized protein YfdQ (DUF2303 family)